MCNLHILCLSRSSVLYSVFLTAFVEVTVSMSMSTLSVPENVGNISICAELAGDLCTEIDISVQSQDSAVAVCKLNL